jgi:hypothetical protein
MDRLILTQTQTHHRRGLFLFVDDVTFENVGISTNLGRKSRGAGGGEVGFCGPKPFVFISGGDIDGVKSVLCPLR